MKIEEILGTLKGDNETWAQVFARVDTQGGIDIKTLTKVVIYLLEEQDGRTHTYENQATYSGGAATIEEYRSSREDKPVQIGIGRVEEEIQPGIPSEDGTDPNVSGETSPETIINDIV